jgi:hypothetical protein
MDVNVEVQYRPWSGSQQVPQEEAAVWVTEFVLVDGRQVKSHDVMLHLETDEGGPWVTLEVKNARPGTLDMFDPNNYEEGSTDAEMSLYVTELTFTELPPREEDE